MALKAGREKKNCLLYETDANNELFHDSFFARPSIVHLVLKSSKKMMKEDSQDAI
jgi:hypothetical protein